MAIHIYLGGRSGGKSVAKDAGFDRREYSPREFNRLQGEIDEVQAKIKTTKGPISKRDLEQVLAKLKAEQAKYKTDDASEWEIRPLAGKFAIYRNGKVIEQGIDSQADADYELKKWKNRTGDSIQSVEKEIANVKRFIAAFEKRGIPAHIGPSSSSWKRS